MCLHVYVRALPGKAVSKMSYTVSGEMLNLTHSLILSWFIFEVALLFL